MNRKYEIDDILAAGESLMRRRGYHATGINDILRESGVPKGSFYNFFASKEAFGDQVLEFYGNRMLSVLSSYLHEADLSPLSRLRAFYRWSIEVNQSENFRYGCLVNNLSAEVGGQNERLAAAADAQFAKWTIRIADCIREGQTAGEITQTYPAEELAEMLHTSFFGALSRAKATQQAQPLELTFKIMFDLLKA